MPDIEEKRTVNPVFKKFRFICLVKFLGQERKNKLFWGGKHFSPACVSLGNVSSKAVDKVHTSLLLPPSTQTVFSAVVVWDQRGRASTEESA